ncbi:hypothetical protein GCM10010349_62840 [Streptomyces flavofungini]|nr:hypothetical protein GCM10010349_62840 [Streptomyces flavofungini]
MITGRWSTACCGGYGPGLLGATCPSGMGRGRPSTSGFARWEADGTWAKLLEHVQVHDDAGGRVEWIVAVDSTINRAHQHAAGARKRGTQTGTNWKIRAARRRIRHSVGPGAG